MSIKIVVFVIKKKSISLHDIYVRNAYFFYPKLFNEDLNYSTCSNASIAANKRAYVSYTVSLLVPSRR